MSLVVNRLTIVNTINYIIQTLYILTTFLYVQLYMKNGKYCMKTNEELLEEAKEVSLNAYCDYSGFPVGACVLYSSGNIYKGCNVENSSFGLSLCAERNAISNAIAAGEKGKILKIAIYSPKTKKCFPCGACRQWLQEFEKGQHIEVVLEDENSLCSVYKIDDIFPFSFNLA